MLHSKNFEVRLARTVHEVRAAQRLRYTVFIEEFGGDGPHVDHENKLEIDRFDDFSEHLLLIDKIQNNQVVGVYRILTLAGAKKAGGFYSQTEFDLSPLLHSGNRLLELGRSCLHADYRGGTGLFYLWRGLAKYALNHDIQILFGTASFHGTDIQAIAPSLTWLDRFYPAPPHLRPKALAHGYQSMGSVPDKVLDLVKAKQNIPPLIKAYLKMGGLVGDGAYVDKAFNTTDVCLIVDFNRINENKKAIYLKEV